MNTTSLYVLFLTLALGLSAAVTTGPVQQTLLIVMACSAIAAALTARHRSGRGPGQAQGARRQRRTAQHPSQPPLMMDPCHK